MNAHKLRNKFFMVCTGKETENMFMMPIDTGNKAIKTENFEFNSGITMLADVPGENEEALMYQGRYYRLSHERNVYLPDKTMDDRYYLLTLFAIAKELEEMSHSKSFIPGELISMDLVVGLPPLYYRGQYKKFREYFYRDGKIVHFVYMGKSYRVTFSNVFVHMQTYAAYLYMAKAIFVDEAWKLLVSNELAGEYLLEIFKVIRAYGGSAICATQDLVDFFALKGGKLGRGILNNSKTKIILNMEPSEAENIRKELDLSEAEAMSIARFERGTGLISTNSNNLIVDFKASQLEKDLITTDRKDLQELKERLQKYGRQAYGKRIPGRVYKVVVCLSDGKQTILMMDKRQRFEIGKKYRFYFNKKTQGVLFGIQKLDAALNVGSYYGAEEIE